jgi:hypothetical protein
VVAVVLLDLSLPNIKVPLGLGPCVDGGAGRLTTLGSCQISAGRNHRGEHERQRVAPPHGGLGFLLEVVPVVEVEEESGEAAVPRREEEDRRSGRPDLEDEEDRGE